MRTPLPEVDITHIRDFYCYLYFVDCVLGGGARRPATRNVEIEETHVHIRSF